MEISMLQTFNKRILRYIINKLKRERMKKEKRRNTIAQVKKS